MNPEEAWLLVKPRVDATNPNERTLRAWRFDMVRGQLAAELKLTRERAADYAAAYAKAHGERLLALIEAVDQLSLAGTFVQAQLERAVTLSGSSYQEVVARAQALRKVGLHWLKTLERFGVVTAQEGDAIRAGRGHLDTAGDLQALAALLTTHWGLLSALQEHQRDKELRLTDQSADQMRAAARDLLEVERQTSTAHAGVDWVLTARRLGYLLERDWDDLRGLILGARLALGELTLPADPQPSILSLHRRV